MSEFYFQICSTREVELTSPKLLNIYDILWPFIKDIGIFLGIEIIQMLSGFQQNWRTQRTLLVPNITAKILTNCISH